MKADAHANVLRTYISFAYIFDDSVVSMRTLLPSFGLVEPPVELSPSRHETSG